MTATEEHLFSVAVVREVNGSKRYVYRTLDGSSVDPRRRWLVADRAEAEREARLLRREMREAWKVVPVTRRTP